jgi:hypothetical protein
MKIKKLTFYLFFIASCFFIFTCSPFSADGSSGSPIASFPPYIPDTVELYGAEDNWRNKFIYLNLNFVWSPSFYVGTYPSKVGAEVLLDIHLLRFLAVKAGVEISPEWVVISQTGTTKDEYTDMILCFPAALAFVLRPGDNIMLEPYVGGSFNLSLNGKTKLYPLSWMAGVQLGLKAGFGVVTFDPRFSMDFNKSKTVEEIPSDVREYWRYTVHFGIGYKFDFINR